MKPRDRILFGISVIKRIIAGFKARVFADSGTFEAESCLNTPVQDLINKGLYDSASLIVTPNAVKSGKIYSLKGTDLTFTRVSVANRTNSVGVLESIASGVPRIEYPIGGGCPSILLEPQRTNLCVYSCQFTNAAWVTNASGITLDNQVLAPDGTLTAGTFESTGSSALLQNANATVVVATTYTSGIWVRLISGSSIVKVRDVSGNETIILPTSTWQYFKVTLAATSTTGRVALVIVSAGTKVAVWNGQLEAGGNATSPIITTASFVTRVLECGYVTDSLLIGQTEGTFFMDCNITYWDTNSFLLGIYGGGNEIYFRSIPNGFSFVHYCVSTQASIAKTGLSLGRHKVAATYKNNAWSLYVDGLFVGADISGTFSGLLDNITFGYVSVAAYPMNGISYNAVSVFKTALNFSQLTALTTL